MGGCVRMFRQPRNQLLDCCSCLIIIYQSLHTMKDNARLINNASEQNESYGENAISGNNL